MRLGLDFSDFLWYNTRMITKTQIKSGAEALLDLSSPVFVGSVIDGFAWVMDDDGHEQWVAVDRLTEVAPLPAPSQKELDDERWDEMEREERMSDFWSFFHKTLDSLTKILIVLIMTTTDSFSDSSFDPWADLSEAEFAEFEADMLREQQERESAEAMAHEAQLERELMKRADFR